MFLTLPLQAQQGGGMSMIFMLVALFAVFYFFMIRPQQKKQKEIQKFRDSLTNGSKIVTAGGIHGTIKDVKDTYFLVTVADGVNVRVEKSMVYASPADANEAQQQAAKK